MSRQISSESASQFSPQENSSLLRLFMQRTSSLLPLLLTESSEIASDVLSDSLNFGQFSGTAGGSLGISESPEFISKFINDAPNGLDVTSSNFLINFFLHHPN
jgi:hypothetical protein